MAQTVIFERKMFVNGTVSEVQKWRALVLLRRVIAVETAEGVWRCLLEYQTDVVQLTTRMNKPREWSKAVGVVKFALQEFGNSVSVAIQPHQHLGDQK